jgi:hypothetical protein
MFWGMDEVYGEVRSEKLEARRGTAPPKKDALNHINPSFILVSKK